MLRIQERTLLAINLGPRSFIFCLSANSRNSVRNRICV